MPTLETDLKTRPLTVALIGNPNTGKSTLFNALAGIQSRVGNYPGVTVEKKIGRVQWDGKSISLVDLPGTYSLSPRTLDEMVSVDVMLGRQPDVGKPDAVVCIVDASNLERNLYLVSQVLDLNLPMILVLNMSDLARYRGVSIDVASLRKKLGIPIVETEAHRKRGLNDLRRSVMEAVLTTPAPAPKLFPEEFYTECNKLAVTLAENSGNETPMYLLERMILDVGGNVESQFCKQVQMDLSSYLTDMRNRLKTQKCRIPAIESTIRYRWIRELLDGVVIRPQERIVTSSDKIDRILTHRYAGFLFFCALMFVVFQAIYRWAKPFMKDIEAGQDWVSSLMSAFLAPGAFQSLLVDGVISGVGGVLVFLPQIVFLFFFIAVLEDCGYMARAAFLMDKLMTKVGLSGKSFVPLMSSFACAIPGVMATRVIENRRDRMVTILVAPLMSCSARLPVYLLLIGAFIPATQYWGGWVTLPGMVLFGMSALGALVAIPVAWLLKKTFFRGETPPFVMELPSYKWPSPRIVLHRVYDRSRAFVVRAGTLIFATTILVWGAGYFPGDHSALYLLERKIAVWETVAEQEQLPKSELESLEAERNRLNSELIEGSYLGSLGHAIEPAVRPLGWDWKIGIGVIASFPAREVIIATLGTIYSLGGDVDKESTDLKQQLQAEVRPDGRKIYNVPVAMSIMVFFALCAQCAATLVVIKRETNSWFWPMFTFGYMTTLAYLGAFVTYQLGMLFV
jgi:ferrous iron transport protein B